MGRFTSVQIYSDNNPNMRSVTFDQAVGASSNKGDSSSSSSNNIKANNKVKVEKVVNPSRSTAGAGSGEFHVYRAARSRETKRVQQMELEDKEQKLELAFQSKNEENRKVEEERTNKRRRKRQREKEAKLRKKNMRLNGITMSKDTSACDGEVDEEEFEYTPKFTKKSKEDEKPNKNVTSSAGGELSEEKGQVPKINIVNDGSFLEMAKKLMNESSEK